MWTAPNILICGLLSCRRRLLSLFEITIRDLADRLHVSYGSCQQILKSLGIRKLSSIFVPRFLTAEMMTNRVQCCMKQIHLHEQYGDQFRLNILTEDETPLNMFIPESKRESCEWKFPDEKATRKMKTSGASKGRCFMLSVFWDSRGIVLLDFAERNETINSDYYCDLLKQVRGKRRKVRNLPYWFLHDNAPIHSSRKKLETLQELGFQTVSHPPYSPDLAPSDFFLFRHLKKYLRGKHFENKMELRQTLENYFSSLPRSHFESAFEEHIHRMKKCVQCNGSHVEK